MPPLLLVQARMSSSRLPGKVLADVCGEPLLALLVRRLQSRFSKASIVVATSDDPSDDAIVRASERLGVRSYRGPLSDVLGRMAGAAAAHRGTVVRLTADCPLIDPAVVLEVIEALTADSSAVYASNVEPRTFPDGLDAEAFDAATLQRLDAEVHDPELREHVTLALRQDPEAKKVGVMHAPDLGALRWTVDTKEDLTFVRSVIERLGGTRHTAGMDDVLSAVRRAPSLADHGLRG